MARPAKMTRGQATALAAQAAERLNEIARMEEALGTEEPPQLSVIRLVRDLNGYRYDYAVIHCGNGKWYASGARSGDALNGLSWEELLDWLATFDLRHVEVILPPADLTAPGDAWHKLSRKPPRTGPDGHGIDWTDPTSLLAPIAYGDGDNA